MAKKISNEEFIKNCDVILKHIDHEGFDYFFCEFESPFSCDQTDPVLFAMWQEYIALSNKVKSHLKTAGGRRSKKGAP
jgi:hypothetical protein